MFTEKLEIICKYKTNKCMDPDCKYSKIPPNTLKESDGLMQYDCFYYHSKSDQRRPVFCKPKNMNNPYFTNNFKGNLYYINYSQYLAINCTSQDEALKHCSNGYEYLYHPMNYKRIECQLFKENKCYSIYCPYYHNQEEEKFFKDFREKAIQNKENFMVPMAEELRKIIKNLKEGLASPSMILDNNSTKNSPKENKKPDQQKYQNSNQDKKFRPNKSISVEKEKKFKTIEGYYILDEVVDFIEDHHHEFKNLKLNLETVTKYICGFLNSKGGTLYFGINDSGVIKGIDVNEKQIKSFVKKLRTSLSQFEPPIINFDEISIDFVPVVKKNGTKLPNTYIVEIKILKDTNNELYFTSHNGIKECYIKRSASINQLKNRDIKEYVKDCLKRNNQIELDSLSFKLENYEGKNMDKVEKNKMEIIEKTLKNTLTLIDNIINDEQSNKKQQ